MHLLFNLSYMFWPSSGIPFTTTKTVTYLITIKDVNHYNVLHPDVDKNNKNIKNTSICKLMLRYVLLS